MKPDARLKYAKLLDDLVPDGQVKTAARITSAGDAGGNNTAEMSL